MIKPVASLDDILHRGDWCAQLQQAWYQHIPLRVKVASENKLPANSVWCGF
jgi:hypothetical protein